MKIKNNTETYKTILMLVGVGTMVWIGFGLKFGFFLVTSITIISIIIASILTFLGTKN